MKVLPNILLTLLTIILMLALGEGVMRLITSQKLIYDLEMVRYAKELKLPQVTRLPGRGTIETFRHKPNAHAHVMGVDIHTNEFGFRDHAIARTTDTTRIQVLGDSVLMGWGVALENTATRVAERTYNASASRPIDIINSGIGNYNLNQMLGLYIDTIDAVKPAITVLYISPDDLEPDPIIRHSSWIAGSQLLAFINNRAQYIQLLAEGNNSMIDFYERIVSGDNPARADNIRSLQQIAEIAHANNSEFLVIYQPELLDLSPNSPLVQIEHKITAITRDLGLRTYSVQDAIPQQYRQRDKSLWVAPDDRHYNALAHEIMGEQLAQILRPMLVQPKPVTGSTP